MTLRDKIAALTLTHVPGKYSPEDQQMQDVGAAGMRSAILEILDAAPPVSKEPAIEAAGLAGAAPCSISACPNCVAELDEPLAQGATREVCLLEYDGEGKVYGSKCKKPFISTRE